MPELKNKRHEQFARQLAKGNSASQSYIDAGYNECRQSASRLSAKADIKQRVTELRKESTEIEIIDGRDPDSGRFLTGNGGGGRQKGSRNKLSERFISDLHDEWEKSGTTALKRVAEDDPVAFVKVVAGVLPRELDATLSVDVSLFAEAKNFDEAYELARQVIGADDTKLIELEAEEPEQ